jgi:pyruvate dehydrogenase E2 component (dihydrolipoamide acetyltransferase)
MATIIRMPEVLAGASEAAIQSWLVQPGQTIAVGVPLAEVETEKAVVEYAAETEGTVLQLLVSEGVSVNVGDPIAIVGAEGESVEGAVPDAPASEAPAAAAPAPVAEPPAPAAAEPSVAAPAPRPAAAATPEAAAVAHHSADSARRFASPLVRRLAKERGLDLAQIPGSGPGGRIVRRDLDGVSVQPTAGASAPAGAAPSSPVGDLRVDAETISVPLTRMRKAIARRLTESKSTVPHFYLVADCRVDRLLALRAEANASSPVKLSVNDFVLKAAAAAFIEVPEANATWGDDAITRYTTVDMSVAVAIDGGLVTPVLRSVERMSVRRGPRRARPRWTVASARARRRQFRGLEPRHVRGDRVLGHHQPAAVGDPRRRSRDTAAGGRG